MSEKSNNLKVCSINDIFFENADTVYNIPIYQRNYAWQREEVENLIHDVYDSMKKNPKGDYYIGTLVTHRRDENVFEVIDGQQRLTTLFIILCAMKDNPEYNDKNNEMKVNNRKLSYSARKVSDNTIKFMAERNIHSCYGDVLDMCIKCGYEYAERGIEEIDSDKKKDFKDYLMNHVKIIRYQVPRDADLNHYFEVMNSRGEQLEKHEIVKAKLADCLHETPQAMERFCQIWEACCDMSFYIQQTYPGVEKAITQGENELFAPSQDNKNSSERGNGKQSIMQLLQSSDENISEEIVLDRNDSFQPIIDFPNFLLVVLKITRMKTEFNFNPTDFTLDDKEIIYEFEKVLEEKKESVSKKEFVRNFAFNLLKAKYYLDNYVIHHIMGNDRAKENPWKLQRYMNNGERKTASLKDLADDDSKQDEMVQLLSMFEVAFTAKQRKNYLFYVLFHLFENGNVEDYLNFLQQLADKYFFDVYLDESKLNERGQPRPNSFDKTIVRNGQLNVELDDGKRDFNTIYPNSVQLTIPLYVFVYTDYRLWKKYADEVRGMGYKKGHVRRQQFFEELGCSDFELDVFNDFYFSRTRKSLEHFYPQANVNDVIKASDINCFGNFAMIGAEANSSGSNWEPKTKLDHYLDPKTNPVSVASLKFRIMLQMCNDNGWVGKDMQQHQKTMLNIIMKSNHLIK